MSKEITIGAVSYLNTKPLVEGLADSNLDLRVVYDLPSRLADRLHRRELDVALIPSFEYLRRPDYVIVSDACIGCRGRVMSVTLFADRPIDTIATLALDEGSRTSAVMVQILLDRLHGLRPQLCRLPIGHGLNDSTSDAVMLIGDRAFQVASDRYRPVWDLGQTWNETFGLPFVFAVWAAHDNLSGATMDRVALALHEARDRGVAAIDSISKREHAAVHLSEQQCVDYLRNHLHFCLEPTEMRGLDLFRRQALKHGFLTEHFPIRVFQNGQHDFKTA